MENKEVLSIQEASEYLGISRDALYDHIRSKRIPAFKIGKLWKFKKSLLEEWITSQVKKASGEK